ncbi:hypothetical protein MMC13_004685 [Lambiella insularis]|nr:hypothetical protein [Lambiella insularis]
MEGGPLRAITHLSLNGINAFVALLEIMILSSVQMQKPFASHFASLLIVVGCYFVWTAIGHELTTHYVYKQLDPTSYGTRGVVMSVLTTMSVTTLFWFFTLGLHKIRVYASAQADCNTQNQ